jgi:hypothetical protein
MSRPARWVPLLLLVMGNAGPVVSQIPVERPPVGYRTPTFVPAGPSYLSAAGYIPTRLILKWRSVPNAQFYQFYRSSTTEPKRMLYEMSLAGLSGFQEMETGDYWHVDWPVDMTSTYTYSIQAVFVDGAGTRSYSTPSPSASAKSPAFVAPANFAYTSALYETPGKLRLTFTWSPVTNAQQYDLVFQALDGRTMSIPTLTSKTTSLVLPDISPHSRYNVCIITVYLPSVRDDTVRSCIDVKV